MNFAGIVIILFSSLFVKADKPKDTKHFNIVEVGTLCEEYTEKLNQFQVETQAKIKSYGTEIEKSLESPLSHLLTVIEHSKEKCKVITEMIKKEEKRKAEEETNPTKEKTEKTQGKSKITENYNLEEIDAEIQNIDTVVLDWIDSYHHVNSANYELDFMAHYQMGKKIDPKILINYISNNMVKVSGFSINLTHLGILVPSLVVLLRLF